MRYFVHFVRKSISYARHRFPPDVIRHAVWLCYRDIEDLLAERGLTVSNELETFAHEAEARLGRIILLVLDNAGWHGAANLKIPDGIRLVHLPPQQVTLHP